jgi:hypothetical protein
MQLVEKKARPSEAPRKVGGFFLFSRPDGTKVSTHSSPGITIQIRLKNAQPVNRAQLLTRKNTEFWLSATD